MWIFLNDKNLFSIARSVGILDIVEKSVSVKSVTAQRPLKDGQFLFRKYRTNKIITITFDLFGDERCRQGDFDEIVKWANQPNAKLSINDSVGAKDYYLVVNCTKLPEYVHFDPTKPMTIEFTAFDPHKYDLLKTTAVLNTTAGTTKTTDFYVTGSAYDTPLSFTIENTGTVAMNTARIQVGDEYIAFENLGLPVGKTLEVYFDGNGIMHISIDGVSVASKRTVDSSDELYIEQNQTLEIAVTTSTKASVELEARGRSL